MHTITLHRASTSNTATSVAALAAWVVVVLAHPTGEGVAVACSMVPAVLAAGVDLRTQRLPDVLVAATAVPVLLAGIVTGALPAMLLGSLLFGIPLFLVHVASPAAIGFGDVKFAVALGATIGLLGPLWVLVALCLASGLTSVVGLIRRSGSLPFGPGLLLGSVGAIVTSAVFPDSLAEGRLPWR